MVYNAKKYPFLVPVILEREWFVPSEMNFSSLACLELIIINSNGFFYNLFCFSMLPDFAYLFHCKLVSIPLSVFALYLHLSLSLFHSIVLLY